MGIYVYTLRKKFVTVNILGEEHRVHAFSYLMKPHWEETQQEKMALARADSLWAGQPLPKFAFCGDLKDLQQGHSCTLETDLKSHIWWDVNRFPGTGVGGIIKEGRGYRYLTSREYLLDQAERWLPSLIASSPEQPAVARTKLEIGALKSMPDIRSLIPIAEVRKQMNDLIDYEEAVLELGHS